MGRIPLPIDAHVEAILATVSSRSALSLAAEPGAGKTTRVPLAMLESGMVRGDILVLEPRRLAARLAAERVAFEAGSTLGDVVGFETRFERKISSKTRLRFMTEGILTRRLLGDPELRGVDAVVLDEFHERHLASDIGLALLKRLKHTTRPDLRSSR